MRLIINTRKFDIARFIAAAALVLFAAVSPLISFAAEPNPKDNPDLFLKIMPSKARIYKGEAFMVSYLLYYTQKISDPGREIDIKIKNCYTEEFAENGPLPDEQISGRLYHVLLLRKYLLIPQTEGRLKLPGVNITINLPAVKDDFFGNETTISKRLSVRPVLLDVQPLPPVPAGLSFAGAVGDFKVDYQFEPSPKFPNILSIHVKIRGNGNLKFSSVYIPSLPAGVDHTELPNIEKDTLSQTGLNADHTFSFQLLSNYRGTYNLGPVTFTCFSPSKNKYVTLSSKTYQWDVKTGPPLPKHLQKNTNEIKIKSDPFLYTKTHISETSENKLFFGSPVFYFTLVLTGCLYVLGWLLARRQSRRLQYADDHRYKTARRRALRTSRKLRTSAGKMSEDVFNRQLSAVLQTYLDDKLTSQNVAPHIGIHQLPVHLQADIKKFWDEQNAMRFSPLKTISGNRNTLCMQVIALIKNLDEHLR